MEGYYHTARSDDGGESPLPYGALRKGGASIKLNLAGKPFAMPGKSAEFSQQIAYALGGRSSQIRIAVLDITDPANPVYGGVNDGMSYQPGSVGKAVVALALFQALANRYPNDVEARATLLRTRRLPPMS